MIAFVDFGGTYIRVLKRDQSCKTYTEQLTKNFNTLKEVFTWIDCRDVGEIYLGIAGRLNGSSISSNDVLILNGPIDEIYQSLEMENSKIHILNDVAAASIALLELTSTGNRNLVVGLGTGTSQSIVLKRNDLFIVSQGEYGFCNGAQNEVSPNNKNFVRDTLNSEVLKCDLHTYIKTLSIWLSNLACIYVPDIIYIFGGAVSYLSKNGKLKEVLNQTKENMELKQSMRETFKNIQVECLPYDSVLLGLEVLSKNKTKIKIF